jgi:hypothetical protein
VTGGRPKYWDENLSQCTSFTTNLTWNGLESKTDQTIERFNRQYTKKCDLPVHYRGPNREHTQIKINLLFLLPIDTVAMVVIAKYSVQVL